MRRVWEHTSKDGYVWLPVIRDIASKRPHFVQGKALIAREVGKVQVDTDVDSYWTPAVRSHLESPNGRPRDASGYGPQRAVWADCDDGYDDEVLSKLKPSFVWETSPGHKQAIWLLEEPLDPSEYHKDGYMGMITEALGSDPSGVDIPQLLRVPGSVHHKRGTHQGKVLSAPGTVYSKGDLHTRVARALGLPTPVAAQIGAKTPIGDRSLQLWKFSRLCAETGLSESMAFKLLNACDWNKWADRPERLREDIAKAYGAASQPGAGPQASADARQDAYGDGESAPEEARPWAMSTLVDFGPLMRKPVSWVLPGIIPEAACGLIVAAPKAGKTRLAIEIALGLASGDAPLGLHVRGKQAVGFFSLEDGEYLFAHRLAEGMQGDREQYHWDGVIRKTKEGIKWYPPKPISLLTGFSGINLKEASALASLQETILEHDLRLVIIDTLSMAIGSSNVSDSKEMNDILKVVREIAKATRCAIAFIHHTRKRVFEKGESVQESILGSTALHAWCEFVMNVQKTEDETDPSRRLGIQTKMAEYRTEYLSGQLKIVKRPPEEDEE